MYFLLTMGMSFQPAMLVYQRVSNINYGLKLVQAADFLELSNRSQPRKNLPQKQFTERSRGFSDILKGMTTFFSISDVVSLQFGGQNPEIRNKQVMTPFIKGNS